jgi:hypothetical protein
MMKCWNSAFNAQGSRVIIVVRGVKTYVASSTRGAQEKRKEGEETQIDYPPKLVEKASLGPSYFVFCKISFPVSYTFDALLLCWNWQFLPP